jgi:hypothetical protein
VNFKQFLRFTSAGIQAWLTIFVTTVYNAVLAIGLFHGKVSFQEYIMAVGPINTMVMAFWLGSETRAAQPLIPPKPDAEQ